MSPTQLQTPEETLERWCCAGCSCDQSVGHLCEVCHDIQVLRELIAERNLLRTEYKAVCKQIAGVNTDRDKIWSRESRLLEGIHAILDGIEKEKALTPVKPGWIVVEEMIRDMLEFTKEKSAK